MLTRSPRRRAGLLVPLFSIPSSRSWGIGEIPDLVALSRWLASAGQRLLQLLPINEMPPGETSPYSALSAMAIDPQYIGLGQLDDFAELGGETRLPQVARTTLQRLRMSATVDYTRVRALKDGVLRRCYERFRDTEWGAGTRRSAALRAYLLDQSWWLDDYALFRALHYRFGERPWTDWPEALRQRDPDAIASAREELADEILFRQYLQWVAADQWGSARQAAGDTQVFGDLPFMVSLDSADVWARQDEFRLDASVGVPPDAFSETGQDWRLPVYKWDVIAGRGFAWLSHRARRYADLFDGYRVDHLVGFYRTYYRVHGNNDAQFTPAFEPAQLELGERVLAVLRAANGEIIAEDLGVVPDFVRESLSRLGIPGYKVFRWERQWHDDGQPFKDPLEYAPVSVATSGTHDTEPMAVWWPALPREDRAAVLAIPSVASRLSEEDRQRALETDTLTHPLREALLDVLYASGSDLVIIPVQDVFGWRDRINQPATVGDTNWTWRLPWPADQLTTHPEAMAMAAQLRAWAERHGRATP